MNQNLSTTYTSLMEKFKEITILSSVSGILGWDMMTMMPHKGINLRSQQMSLLARIGHRMGTDPEMEENS